MFKRIINKIGNRIHYHRWLKPSKLNAVYVVSTGRTGTKFFETFFNTVDSRTFSIHEPAPDLFDTGINKFREGWPISQVEEYIRSHRVRYLRSFSGKRIKRYVECNPFAAVLLNEIKNVFPKTKYIIITRKPKTYLKSALNKSPFDDGKSYFYGEKDGRLRLRALDFKADAYKEEWENFSRLEKIAWYWNKCNTMLMDYYDNHKDHCIHIRFEDVFSKVKVIRLETIKNMLVFLGIEIEDNQLHKLLDLSDIKKNATQTSVFEGVEEETEKELAKFYELTATANNKIYGNEQR